MKNGTPLTKAAYQDEVIARHREGSRSDALPRPEGHLSHAGPHGRRPLRPRLERRSRPPAPCSIRAATARRRRAAFPTLQRLGEPDGSDAGPVRHYRASRSATRSASSGASSSSRASSSRTRSGRRRRTCTRRCAATTPAPSARPRARRTPASTPTTTTTSSRSTRTATSSSTGRTRPGSTRCTTLRSASRSAVQGYVRSRPPDLPLRLLQQLLPGSPLPGQRGSNGRTPTDYDLNLSLGYNINIGPVTVTPQAYLLNALNRQTVTSVDATFNPSGSFVDESGEPVLRSGRRRAGNGRTRWRHLHRVHALPGQPGLPEGESAQQPPSPPCCSEGHLLRTVHIVSLQGRPSGRPFFLGSDLSRSAARTVKMSGKSLPVALPVNSFGGHMCSD